MSRERNMSHGRRLAAQTQGSVSPKDRDMADHTDPWGAVA